jgi:hypothetical protein
MLKQDKEAADVLSFGKRSHSIVVSGDRCLRGLLAPARPKVDGNGAHRLLSLLAKSDESPSCFYAHIPPGHVVYEMATGAELDISRPDVSHMVAHCPNEIVEVCLHALP